MTCRNIYLKGIYVNVSLQSTSANLEEVVVVGYGTQKKKEVTGAVSQVNPVNISTLVTPSVDKQLGGRATGVLVTNSSGLVNEFLQELDFVELTLLMAVLLLYLY